MQAGFGVATAAFWGLEFRIWGLGTRTARRSLPPRNLTPTPPPSPHSGPLGPGLIWSSALDLKHWAAKVEA